jgi:hypothetical protein
MDDETRKRPCGRVMERGNDDTWQQGKGGKEDDMTGGGPTRVKVRVAERDEAAHEPLIRAPRSWPLKAASLIPDPPPPPLKGRKAGGGGGVRNGLHRR